MIYRRHPLDECHGCSIVVAEAGRYHARVATLPVRIPAAAEPKTVCLNNNRMGQQPEGSERLPSRVPATVKLLNMTEMSLGNQHGDYYERSRGASFRGWRLIRALLVYKLGHNTCHLCAHLRAMVVNSL